jgi:predicted SnoaL-like aldol condensation-catalyzing enzyme
MSKTAQEQSKAPVIKAFDTLFNKRNDAAAKNCWSDRYIQHSAHIAPGRYGLFNLISTPPNTLRCENRLIVAESDNVAAWPVLRQPASPAWTAANVVRIEGAKLAEHWDVIEGRSEQRPRRQWVVDVRQ